MWNKRKSNKFVVAITHGKGVLVCERYDKMKVAVKRIPPNGRNTQPCNGLADIFPRSEFLLVYFFLEPHSPSPSPRPLKYIPLQLCFLCSSRTLLGRSFPPPFVRSRRRVVQFGFGFSFEVLCWTLHNNLSVSIAFPLPIFYSF